MAGNQPRNEAVDLPILGLASARGGGVYGYGEEQSVQIGLLVFNTVLIIIEIWQAATGDWEEYLNSPWNWVDWVRFA